MGRVATPDEELVRSLTVMLWHENAAVQEAAAEILARMIQQVTILPYYSYGSYNFP